MRSDKTMDRVICGDVGFGKTEVAMRAAFVAARAGRQVCMLAPTTLLVEQHAKNFADRSADFPIRIASLSRLRSTQERSEEHKSELQSLMRTSYAVFGLNKKKLIHVPNSGYQRRRLSR